MAKAREHGRLVRRRGGFWTTPATEMLSAASFTQPYDEWDWYASTQTVRALVNRGLLTLSHDAQAAQLAA